MAYECQKFFYKVIMQDYSSSILFLDTILTDSLLPLLCQIILSIKS